MLRSSLPGTLNKYWRGWKRALSMRSLEVGAGKADMDEKYLPLVKMAPGLRADHFTMTLAVMIILEGFVCCLIRGQSRRWKPVNRRW
jgi:hypothetical protein